MSQGNELIKILEAFPNREWNWNYVSSNPNITMDYIDSHPEFPWDFRWVSMNPNLTLDYFMQNREKPWDLCDMASNPAFSLEEIENNTNIWNASIKSSRFFWRDISRHPDITLDFILKYENELNIKSNSTSFLGGTKNITIQDIQNYPDLFWCSDEITKNPNMTLDSMLDFICYDDGDVDDNLLYNIGKHPSVTFDEVDTKHPELLKSSEFMSGLSRNQNITLNIIHNNLEYEWD